MFTDWLISNDNLLTTFKKYEVLTVEYIYNIYTCGASLACMLFFFSTYLHWRVIEGDDGGDDGGWVQRLLKAMKVYGEHVTHFHMSN